MARQLVTEHQNSLEKCRIRTTLSITLGDGTTLNFATADINFNSIAYLGKLAPVEALNLELTQVVEGLRLRITNVGETLGQLLINTANVLDGVSATLGCYFQNQETNAEWHDVKIEGEIEIGEINADWIEVFFLSKPDAVTYGGITIASAFPEEIIPTAELPGQVSNPVYNDIENYNQGQSIISRKIDFFDNDWRSGNYFLPEYLMN